MNNSLSIHLKRLALGVAVCLGANAANAAVVFEDNFDADNFTSIWMITAGGVDVGQYDDLCNNQGSGGTSYCVDTEGTGAGTNASFKLLTSITTLVAGDYTFSFDYGNNDGSGTPDGDNILDWAINSDQGLVSSGSVNSGTAADFSYANYLLSFSVLSPVTNAVISFAQVGVEGDWGGTVLDNVKLELTNPYPVPAPATALLLGAGLLGLGRRIARG